MSDQRIVFKRDTLKLPCRANEFKAGRRIAGYEVLSIISVDAQKSVFSLNPSAVLCVRHESRRLPEDLLAVLLSDRKGLVHVLKAGTIGGYWYTIDRKLDSLPAWAALTDSQRLEYIRQMAYAVNALHDTGYCHLDIKPEHFGIDANGEVRLIDLDSAKPYTGSSEESGQIEYTLAYAAPEILENRYSTASDYYSLGKSIAQWSGINEQSLYMDWRRIVRNLVRADQDSRYNYTQIRQAAGNQKTEANTGPRTYKKPVAIGTKTAWSDRQLALYLTQNYSAAARYVNDREGASTRGNTTAEKVAGLIHTLDPRLPLWWYGKEYVSTKAIADAMSANTQRKDPQFVELLRSGILLDFPQIVQGGSDVVGLLRSASNDPEGRYWDVSNAFGGKFVQQAPPVSLTRTVEKRKELDRLLGQCLRYGDPATLASILESIPADPKSRNADSVIAQLRAVALDESNINLTNISASEAFGRHIVTSLPEPGHHSSVSNIGELFTGDTKYLIRKRSFDEWVRTNTEMKRMGRERNLSVLRSLGWLVLGIGLVAVIIAILPYLLAALAVILFFAILAAGS